MLRKFGLTAATAIFVVLSPSAKAMTLNPTNTIGDDLLTNARADSSPYDLQDGPFSWGATFESSDGAGKAIFKFQNASGLATKISVTLGSVLQGLGARFVGGVKVKWVGGESIFIPRGQQGTFSISKLLAENETGVLKVIYGDPVKKRETAPGIQLEISEDPINPVPVPAALPLMGTALFGMAWLARARKRKEA